MPAADTSDHALEGHHGGGSGASLSAAGLPASAPSPIALVVAGRRHAPVAVLGDGRRDALATVGPARAARGPGDLLVLAPDRRQASNRGWLARASAAAALHAHEGGAAYVLADPAGRLRLAWRLRRHGVAVAWAVLHREHAGALTLVPLAPGPLLHAATRLARGPRRRRVARLVARAPGASRALALLMPAVGLVVRRRGPIPRAAVEGSWPATPWQPAVDPPPLLSSDGRTAVLRLFRRGAYVPSSIVKVALTGAEAERRRREAAAAERAAPGARAAGARVSVPSIVETAGGGVALVQEALRGAGAADALAARPRSLAEVLVRVGGWIARWNGVTAAPTELGPELLREHLLDPAEALADVLPDGGAYLRALHGVCRRWEGRVAPLVAAHNDLTMGNLLLEPGGGIAIVDWESAVERALPLTDLLYACADAVAAAEGYRDRGGAWRRAFVAPGPVRERVAAAEAAVVRATGMDPGLRELCFQACWLHHARNERRAEGNETSFLELARRASRRLTAAGGGR